jgi:hypothetical protein
MTGCKPVGLPLERVSGAPAGAVARADTYMRKTLW